MEDPKQRQVGGAHYLGSSIQPFEYSMANKLDPHQHTIIKYVTRCWLKGGLEDLEKASHTLDLYKEEIKACDGKNPYS